MKSFEPYQIDCWSRKLRIFGSIFIISISFFLCRNILATPVNKRFSNKAHNLLDKHEIIGHAINRSNNTPVPPETEADPPNCAIQEEIKRISVSSGSLKDDERNEKANEEYNAIIERIVERLEEEALENKIEDFFDV